MPPPGGSPRPKSARPRVPFNPLFLYGGVGLGKTHLMHAIAWHIRTQDPARKVIYLSAEKFMYQFIARAPLPGHDGVQGAVPLGRRADDRRRAVHHRQGRHPGGILPHLQRAGGPEPADRDLGRQVARPTSKAWRSGVRSRLGWGMVADLHPTTYELRLASWRPRPSRPARQVPPKVLEFLAHKITSNVRELEGALQPPRRPRQAVRPRRSRWRARRRCCTTCCGARPPRHHRGDPEARSPSTTTSAWPTCLRPAAPAPWRGRARWRCICASS